MILKNALIKNVIAVHGITDLTHSILYNNLPKLLVLQNSVYFFSKKMLNRHVNDILFLVSSVVHFRHDFPSLKIKNITLPPCFLSAFFLFGCIFLEKIMPFNIGSSIFILYMTLNHVPNHYKRNMFHMKQDEPLNIFVISFFTVFVNAFADYYHHYFYDFYNNYLFRSLVISHTLYNEYFIHYKKSTDILQQ